MAPASGRFDLRTPETTLCRAVPLARSVTYRASSSERLSFQTSAIGSSMRPSHLAMMGTAVRY